MCGRYALGVRMAFVRRRLEEQGMQVDEAPEDDEVRETYNFAPGYYGAVYRGDATDHHPDDEEEEEEEAPHDNEAPKGRNDQKDPTTTENKTKYKLQKMRWGLIPFWTKRQPDYGSMMRTINCREDSLIEDRGMWTSMKRKKRCIVVCQGFYEWLKKGPGGKEKIPHYIKRKDGDLMCFAGLWDCVQYEGSDEKLYTYTIITTDSNAYLKFLHDRMPVILEPGSDKMKKWLDPHQTTWTKELQSILKPYDGELECYPVSKDVGKVGNNSPDFIVPVNSKQNKNNIANFFANTKRKDKDEEEEEEAKKSKLGDKKSHTKKADDDRKTKDDEWSEVKEFEKSPRGIKRELSSSPEDKYTSSAKTIKKTDPPQEKKSTSDSPLKVQGREMRSATKNISSPSKQKSYGTSKQASDGSQRITNFFKK